MFDGVESWRLKPSELAEREIKREAYKAWQAKMLAHKDHPRKRFDWFAWGPISLMAIILLFGIVAFVSANHKHQLKSETLHLPADKSVGKEEKAVNKIEPKKEVREYY